MADTVNNSSLNGGARVRTFPANAPTLTSLTPSSLVCNGTNTVTLTGSGFSKAEVQFLVRGLDVTSSVMVSSDTSATLTPKNVSGLTATITADQASTNASGSALTLGYTASNTFSSGDGVRVTGTSNQSGLTSITGETGYFNVQNLTVNPVNLSSSFFGLLFMVIPGWTNPTQFTSASDSGTATLKSIPITVSNPGLPQTLRLTCN